MLKHYSYQGSSPADALNKAKADLGEDLVLVTTKQLRAKTLNQAPLFEVIVCKEVENDKDASKDEQVKDIKRQIEAYTNLGAKAKAHSIYADSSIESVLKAANETAARAVEINEKVENAPKKPEPRNPQSIFDKAINGDEDVSMSISRVASQISELANVPQNPEPSLDYTAKMRDLEKKVDKISDKLSLLADAVWEDKAASRGDINIPPEFATIYKRAAISGMKKEHLKGIMEATIANMPSKMKSNPAAIERYFYHLLEKMLPSKPSLLNGNKQKIVMLIGPTGVGKTTTLSKLAYKYAYEKEVQFKTGIITLDSYRIGAVEQLSQYAQVMKMRMAEAINVDEFKSALRSFSGYDMVLIDTVGSSQYDKEKLAKLNEFLESTDAQIEVNLVLSANTKVEDLLDIYEGFSFAKINSLIITKLDETKIFGNIFSLIYETGIPVSYFSVGQNVPDDIREADAGFLVKCVLEGFDNGSSK